MSTPLLLTAFLALCLFIYRRIHYHRYIQYSHIPQPPTSFIFGHMKYLHQFMSQGPPGQHIDLALVSIWHSLGRPPLFLMDLRPVGPCLCIVASHHLAEQISRSSATFPWSVPKSYTVGELKPLIGHESILIKEGQEWKDLRKRFGVGFATGHLMSLLPVVTEKAWLFMRLLERVKDEKKVVKLDKLTQGLTVDVIGEVVMEVDVGAQEELLAQPDISEHAGDYRDQELAQLGEGDDDEKGQLSNFTKIYYRLITSYSADGKPPIDWLSLLTKPFSGRRRQYLSAKVDSFLRDFVQRKHQEEYHSSQSLSSPPSTTTTTTHNSSTNPKSKKSRSILSLSLSPDQTPMSTSPSLPPQILTSTTDALKTFLFAGHDTTAILIGWVLYYLSICPRAHARITSELNTIFGEGATPANIKRQLVDGPEGGAEKVNRMVYCHAVIKEALRLHPPAGTARRAEGGTGFEVTELAGCLEKGGQEDRSEKDGQWNLDGMVLYNCATIIHRDPSVYGATVDEFWPERWLSDTTESRKEEIPAGAWRPFERGPRDCIGRDLAIIETKVVVALVHGRYEFVKVGLGEKIVDEKEGREVVDETGCCMVKEKLYTRRQITARAADGMRMKVQLAKGVVSGGLEG
ncbi:cytochrome P450 [Sordaria brevicollis]|uniref:Cytochrome P450 n=1 Tax=Sordaria brevicollis TaxID=83679 RepID=A0AAE0PMF0_SORBR|nr:cytochrome P450 [Sordaria brevicollis]